MHKLYALDRTHNTPSVEFVQCLKQAKVEAEIVGPDEEGVDGGPEGKVEVADGEEPGREPEEPEARVLFDADAGHG